MKHLFFPLLGALVAFAPLAVADPILPADGAVEHFSLQQADKKKKTKKRDPRKEATRKKKELREMGVKNVRVASPGDWPKGVPVPKETVLESKGQQPGVGFVYETNNYRFHSPVALDDAACETVGRLFECAYAANKAVGEVMTAVQRNIWSSSGLPNNSISAGALPPIRPGCSRSPRGALLRSRGNPSAR